MLRGFLMLAAFFGFTGDAQFIKPMRVNLYRDAPPWQASIFALTRGHEAWAYARYRSRARGAP